MTLAKRSIPCLDVDAGRVVKRTKLIELKASTLALRGSTEEAQFRASESPSNGHRKTHEDVHEPTLD